MCGARCLSLCSIFLKSIGLELSMIRKYTLLFFIGLIWRSQFIFQKMALVSFSPALIGVGRAATGFITLYLICRMLNIRQKAHYSIGLYALIGLFEAAIPFTLIPWGQQFVSTSQTSILMGTIPFFVILFTPLINAKYRVTVTNVLSIIVGFIGLVVLFLPEIVRSEASISLWGQ